MTAFVLTGCVGGMQTKAIDQLAPIDNLLAEITDKPQLLNAPSDKATTVTGAMGTLIQVDPEQLETVDGSPLGAQIEIEFLEMTDPSSLLLNNAQTVSNGEILVTGGAYYLNMTSDGKQLKMKAGKALEVEFPKLTENEMGFFIGERDDLGQLNWTQAEQNFASKDLKAPQKPKPQKTKDTRAGIESILGYITDYESNMTEEEIKENQRQNEEFERRRKEYETAVKTYEAVEVLNFGWINCDRFLNDPSPKINIQLIVNDDALTGARIYAVFRDIKSVMTSHYYKGQQGLSAFQNVPKGRELYIIALSTKNQVPYMYETTIQTDAVAEVQLNFVETTLDEVKEKLNNVTP